MRFFILPFLLIFFSCGLEQNSENAKPSISLLSEAILKSPDNIDLLQQRKVLFLKNDNLEAALIDQEQIVSLDSSNHLSWYELADIQYKIAKKDKPNYYRFALSSLMKEMPNQEVHIPSLLLRGKLQYLYRNHQESLKDLNNTLKENPYDSEAYFYKGLNYKELGDIEKAISQFQTTVEQNPFHVMAYEQLAFIYASMGDTTLALMFFDNALSVDSSNIKTWYNKGKYLQDLERYNESEKCYYAILKRDNFNEFANYNLGYIHFLRQEYEMAANYFSDAIYTNSAYADAYYSRGLCFNALKNIPQARVDFQTALRLDETFEEARIELQKLP